MVKFCALLSFASSLLRPDCYGLQSTLASFRASILNVARWKATCTYIEKIEEPGDKAKARFTIWRNALALHQSLWNAKIFKILPFFHGKMQECNAEEHKDRIQVYLCIATSIASYPGSRGPPPREPGHEATTSINAKVMQCNTSPCVILWTGPKSTHNS